MTILYHDCHVLNWTVNWVSNSEDYDPPPPPNQWQWEVLRVQRERCQALRSSACRVDSGSGSSSGGSSSSSGGSQSVHRHIKVLMTGLRERNAHSLENTRTVRWTQSPHSHTSFTGHAGDRTTGRRRHLETKTNYSHCDPLLKKTISSSIKYI